MPEDEEDVTPNRVIPVILVEGSGDEPRRFEDPMLTDPGLQTDEEE